jgi:hypothetical protein
MNSARERAYGGPVVHRGRRRGIQQLPAQPPADPVVREYLAELDRANGELHRPIAKVVVQQAGE